MAFAILVVPVGLIMKQPDLGTSLLVMASGLAVIYFAGLSWKLILPPVLIGVIGLILIAVYGHHLCEDGMDLVVLHEYQRQRICTLLDPTRDPLGKGFHIIQGMIAYCLRAWPCLRAGNHIAAGFIQRLRGRTGVCRQWSWLRNRCGRRGSGHSRDQIIADRLVHMSILEWT